jgi:hypothetical protein
MELSPEQFVSLKRVLSDPAAKAAALVAIPTEKIEKFLGKMEGLVRRQAGSFGVSRLLVRFAPDQSGGQELNEQSVRGLIAAQTLIVTVGDDGKLMAANTGDVSLPQAVRESETGPSVCLLCSAGVISVFAAGKVITEIGSTPALIHGRSDWQRSWRELPKSFDDHFKNCVDREQGLRYWFNRQNRVLLAGPDGTEKIFHHNLFWWCNNFIKDALDVYADPQMPGQDKTDLIIVTEVGNIVIEVKWLGKNEHNTRYAQIRIKEGMLQVAEYLNNNGRLMQGYLVIYDARSNDQHQNGCSYPMTCRHTKCEEPVIYFLRSESPSELAVRVAKGTTT